MKLTASVLVVGGITVFAQGQPSFTTIQPLIYQVTLPTVVSGLSADGSVAVGLSQGMAFRWTAVDGTQGLGLLGSYPTSSASGVSADGTVICGTGFGASGPHREAFYWTAAAGLVPIGDLGDPTHYSQANAISADGSTIVGNSQSLTGDEGYRWTAATGMVGLGYLPGGSNSSAILGVSGDGSILVGSGSAAGGTGAFRWTQAGGLQPLGDLAGGTTNSEALGVSSDGSVIVGYGNDPNGQLAFHWTVPLGMQGMPDARGILYHTRATCASQDGGVICGIGFVPNVGQSVGFIWTASGGMRDVNDVLRNDMGLVLDPQISVTLITAVSADGRSIGGQYRINSSYYGFVATGVHVGRCGSADFNCDGDLGTDADIEAFFACLAGNCPPLPCTGSADFNGDGDLGTDSDIEAFFRVLGGGAC